MVVGYVGPCPIITTLLIYTVGEVKAKKILYKNNLLLCIVVLFGSHVRTEKKNKRKSIKSFCKGSHAQYGLKYFFYLAFQYSQRQTERDKKGEKKIYRITVILSLLS